MTGNSKSQLRKYTTRKWMNENLGGATKSTAEMLRGQKCASVLKPGGDWKRKTRGVRLREWPGGEGKEESGLKWVIWMNSATPESHKDNAVDFFCGVERIESFNRCDIFTINLYTVQPNEFQFEVILIDTNIHFIWLDETNYNSLVNIFLSLLSLHQVLNVGVLCCCTHNWPPGVSKGSQYAFLWHNRQFCHLSSRWH